MAGSVVDAAAVAEGVVEVGRGLGDGGGVGQAKGSVPVGAAAGDEVDEAAESLVAEAGATLFVRRGLGDELLCFVEDC